MSTKIIDGNVNLGVTVTGGVLHVLPDLSDVSVMGYFYCPGNRLTSLKGCPPNIGKQFSCAINKITTLVGGPVNVGSHYYCSKNELRDLRGAPEIINGTFSCANNKLTSLDGCPKTVTGDFHCYENSVKFTEDQIRAVCQVGGQIFR